MPRRYNDAIHKDSIGALLHPQSHSAAARGKDGRRKSGTPVRNYRLDNRANIKELQAQNRQRREEEAAPAAEPFKLKQFKNVKSRLFTSAPLPQDSKARPGSTEEPALGRDFLKKGSRDKVATELRQEALRRRQQDVSAGGGGAVNVTAMGSKLFGATSAAAAAAAAAGCGNRPVSTTTPPDSVSTTSEPARVRGARGGERAGCYSTDCCGGAGVTPRKEAVPRAADLAHLAPRSSRDFVAANRMQAAEMKARNVSDEDKTFTHESYGRVPEYLVSRQLEWEREAERRKAEAPDPSCPPGMQLMPEEDRLSTLRQLQENESVCQARLNKFPLVVQTPLLQRRVDDLHSKLKEIDAAKAIFSRSRVYVARDS